MRKLLFVFSVVGLGAGLCVAYLAAVVEPALPPAFQPATNPYAKGIYAEGILESDQASGANINVYSEVPGTIKKITVSEGQAVRAGSTLLVLDDSVQRAAVEQLNAQVQASLTLLNELKAEPRKETLDVNEAQVVAAEAALRTAQDTLEKQQAAYRMNPKSISKDSLDNATNAALTAKANLEVARKQRDLTKAGAWTFDIENQQKQYEALTKSYASADALLAKYTLRAPKDGIVLAINASIGSYASGQGAYDTYTQGMDPLIVLGTARSSMNVRCYVDEILVPRLPDASKMKAEVTVRGSNTKIPATFVRLQPFVSPKIELSNQRQERVDVRVLPLIFRLEQPKGRSLYPGELVDVYIGE